MGRTMEGIGGNWEECWEWWWWMLLWCFHPEAWWLFCWCRCLGGTAPHVVMVEQGLPNHAVATPRGDQPWGAPALLFL